MRGDSVRWFGRAACDFQLSLPGLSEGQRRALHKRNGSAVRCSYDNRSAQYHSVPTDGGNTMSRGFCAECGSRLFARISGRADAIGIHLTSLDDPNRYHPTMDIWTSSALKWAHMDPSLQKLAKGPPPH